MKKTIFALSILFSFLTVTVSQAQTPKQVLDKCAATLSSRDGVKADFSMSSAQYGNATGKIAIKGKMFHATTPMATMWFDGKTLWTYMSNNEEVNVTNPSEAQLQVLNPYNFVNMYKNGFKIDIGIWLRIINIFINFNQSHIRLAIATLICLCICSCQSR